MPRGQGRLCQWENKKGRTFDSYADFATFHNSLDLECYHENGLDETRERDNNPGVFSFRPTKDMPDTIYYQVNMNRLRHIQYSPIVLTIP